MIPFEIGASTRHEFWGDSNCRIQTALPLTYIGDLHLVTLGGLCVENLAPSSFSDMECTNAIGISQQARRGDESTYLIILDQCFVVFVSDALIRSPLASDDIEACELHRRLSRRCHCFSNVACRLPEEIEYSRPPSTSPRRRQRRQLRPLKLEGNRKI